MQMEEDVGAQKESRMTDMDVQWGKPVTLEEVSDEDL